MSKTTWFAEFCPTPIGESTKSDLAGVNYSLKKWEGLRRKELGKHGLDVATWEMYGGDNCPFCLNYTIDGEDGILCSDRCPLVRVLGEPCDKGEAAPFGRFLFHDDAEPMIRALKDAKRRIEEDWE